MIALIVDLKFMEIGQNFIKKIKYLNYINYKKNTNHNFSFGV